MKNTKLYNVIFPIWLLVLVPTMWLIAVPLNIIIDSIVLILALAAHKIEGKKEVFKKAIFKVVIFGFIADIIGSGLLFLPTLLDVDYSIVSALATNPYTNIYSVVILIVAAIFSAIIIYILNRQYSFNVPHVTETNKKKIALVLAIFTLPYMFFVPTTTLYKETNTQIVVDDSKKEDTSVVEENKLEEIKEIVENSDIYSYKNFKNEYKGKTEKNIVEIYSKAAIIANNTDFIEDIKSESTKVDDQTKIFEIYYCVDSISDESVNNYNDWSEKVALLIMSVTDYTTIQFNIITRDDTTIQTDYTYDHFLYKYDMPFEDIINNDEMIESILK